MSRSKMFKVLKIAVVIVAVCYLGYQLYSSAINPLSTEYAIFYEASDGVDINAVIIRDEKVIKDSYNGVKNYVVSEGGKVAKDGTIAELYNDEDSANAKLQIAEIDKKIAGLTEISTYNNLDAADMDILNGNLNTAYYSMLSTAQRGFLSNTSSSNDDLLSCLNRKQIVMGEAKGYDSLIASYTAQRDSLAAKASDPSGTITASEAGYFISKVDGYENHFDLKKLDSITPKDLKSIKNAEKGDSAYIGKIVSDYTWYIAATMSIDDSYDFKEKSRYNIKTNLSESETIDATVTSINRSSGKNAVVVFSCSDMNDELAGIRVQEMTVIKESYTGLRVSSGAVRFVDNVKGVYVVSGEQLKFVKVNVLYSTDTYDICKYENSDESVLRIYDEVVVKGKNLKDGKTIS